MRMDNFFSAYSPEDSCKLYFKKQSEATSIMCSRCGGNTHYWIISLRRWKQYLAHDINLAPNSE
jgi:hypothetical protein